MFFLLLKSGVTSRAVGSFPLVFIFTNVESLNKLPLNTFCPVRHILSLVSKTMHQTRMEPDNGVPWQKKTIYNPTNHRTLYTGVCFCITHGSGISKSPFCWDPMILKELKTIKTLRFQHLTTIYNSTQKTSKKPSITWGSNGSNPFNCVFFSHLQHYIWRRQGHVEFRQQVGQLPRGHHRSGILQMFEGQRVGQWFLDQQKHV